MKLLNLVAIFRDAYRLSRSTRISAGVKYFTSQLLVRANLRLNTSEWFCWNDSTRIHFRRNRGDLQSIREVLIEEHYVLPEYVEKYTLVDLGANIGLTSLWLSQKYGFKNIVAIEPVAANFSLLSKNLESNNVNATLINAAIGPKDGVCFFAANESSNQGRISSQGEEINMVSMDSVLKKAGLSNVDVVKLDIEGAEEELVSGDLSWLSKVSCIIAELHPNIADIPKVISVIEGCGFKFLPANDAGSKRGKQKMDVFIKKELLLRMT